MEGMGKEEKGKKKRTTEESREMEGNKTRVFCLPILRSFAACIFIFFSFHF